MGPFASYSVTEAEYVAASEVVKEIMFLYQLMISMGTKVPLPIKIKVDNVEVFGYQTIVVFQREPSMLIQGLILCSPL